MTNYKLTNQGTQLEDYFISFNLERLSELEKISSSKKATIYLDEKNNLVLKVYAEPLIAKQIFNNYQYLLKKDIEKYFVRIFGIVWFEDVTVIVMERVKAVDSKEYLLSITDSERAQVVKKLISSIRIINKKGFFHRDIAHYGNWYVLDNDILLIDFDSTKVEKYNLLCRCYLAFDELYSFAQALIIILGKKKGFFFAKLAALEYSFFLYLWWPIIKVLLISWSKTVNYLALED